MSERGRERLPAGPEIRHARSSPCAVDARLLRNAGRTRRGPKPPALRSEVLMAVFAALAAPVKSLAAIANATVASTV
jgi:hypothetical protein